MDTSLYSKIDYKTAKPEPFPYAIPFVTGKKYKVSFGKVGLDWETLDIHVSKKWESTDKPIYIVNNFTDIRAKIEVKIANILIPNNSIGATPVEWETGHNLI
jgi:hypothetical protein